MRALGVDRPDEGRTMTVEPYSRWERMVDTHADVIPPSVREKTRILLSHPEAPRLASLFRLELQDRRQPPRDLRLLVVVSTLEEAEKVILAKQRKAFSVAGAIVWANGEESPEPIIERLLSAGVQVGFADMATSDLAELLEPWPPERFTKEREKTRLLVELEQALSNFPISPAPPERTVR